MKPFKPLLSPVLLSFALGIASALSGGGAFALTNDREQPIYIESDSAERNDKKGITVYEGRVKMEQGSMKIRADKVTIHSIDNKVSRIIATGSPARYEQQPSPDKKPVQAEGGTIKYEIDAERLLLTTNATIAQEGTTMSGDRIDYDIAQSLMKAAGNSRSNNQRIQMIIEPETGKATEEKAETP